MAGERNGFNDWMGKMKRLGILSDTHGDVGRTQKAMEVLLGQGVDEVVHCGDVGSTRVLDVLVELAGEIPVTCVLGNVDHWDRAVRDYPQIGGVRVAGRFAERMLEGMRIGVVHGDDDRLFREKLESEAYDVICFGHSHMRADDMGGRTRLINPGAVYRAAIPSVAVLELPGGELRFLSLEGEVLRREEG